LPDAKASRCALFLALGFSWLITAPSQLSTDPRAGGQGEHTKISQSPR
jgi:hypothetical protein